MRPLLTQLPRRLFSTSLQTKTWANSIGKPSLTNLPFDISEEVTHALATNSAIVALESTLITHGLPPPYSSTLPQECEQILRSQNVTAATIAILNGRIKVGLTSSDLERLAELGHEATKSRKSDKLWKVGRRELGAALIKKVDGGTTVSATMAIAHLAGIKIFSTGGIGGVHRGAETSFDISSDLISLSDTPVTVICAGSKSILDIGLTLEYLEAHAVPVASYGTDHWPAFYSPISGFKAPVRLDGALQVAQTIHLTSQLGLPSSLLLGVPIPEEFHSVGSEIQEAVEIAVRESVENGVSKSGKGVTPWLLGRVGVLTKGKAIYSNMALIKNNVKVGGEIALEYSKLIRGEVEGSKPLASTSTPMSTSSQPSSSPSTSNTFMPSIPAPTPTLISPKSSLTVIGSLAIDLTLLPSLNLSPLSTTAPGSITLTLGGVASNVASASSSLGISDVLLVSPISTKDFFGEMAKVGLGKRGMRTDGLIEVEGEEVRTASCGILLDGKGDLVGGVADMDITGTLSGDEVVKKIINSQSKLVCFDGNLSVKTIASVLKHCEKENISSFFEPTSNQKSLRILQAIESLSSPSTPSSSYPILSYATPNIQELSTLYSHLSSSEHKIYQSGLWFDHINVSSDSLTVRLPNWIVSEGIVQMAVQLLPVIGCLFIKSGSRGIIVVQRVSGVDEVASWTNEESKMKGTVVSFSSFLPDEAVVVRYYDGLVIDEKEIKNVTGAGDNLAGAILASLVRGLRVTRPEELDLIVEIAQKAACNALKNTEAVGDHKSLRSLLPLAV